MKHRIIKRGVGALVAVIAILVLGASAWFVKNSSHLFQPSKSRVEKAFANLTNSSTFHLTVALDLAVPTRDQAKEKPVPLVLSKFNGDVRREGETMQLAGTLAAEMRDQGRALYANGDIRVLSDAVAFRLATAPAALVENDNLVSRWTYILTSPVKVQANGGVRGALAMFISNLTFKDSTKTEAERLDTYRTEFKPEDEQLVLKELEKNGNANAIQVALVHVLQAYDTQWAEVQIDSRDQIRKIEVALTLPNDNRPAVLLTVRLSDYGKEVDISRPPQELTVKPDVFKTIWTGDLQ